jgi:hypothetical protein
VYKFSNLRPLMPLKFDTTTNTASVVTLTDYPYKLGDTTLPVYLWVTAVPEVQNICRGFPGGRTRMCNGWQTRCSALT